MKKNLDLIKKRKEELLILLNKVKNPDLKNNIVKQVVLLSSKFNLKRNKDEKQIYCKKCCHAYDNKTKIRFEKIKKNKIKIMQKIIICGNCNAVQKIKL